MVIRRQFLVGVGTAAVGALLPGQAWAGVARGLRLEELVRRSTHIVRGKPLEAYSEWARFGDERRIVTYTRLRVDEPLVGGGFKLWWHGNIQPEDPAAWFTSFRSYMEIYMEIGNLGRVEEFTIGAELESMSIGIGAEWPAFFRTSRRLAQ